MSLRISSSWFIAGIMLCATGLAAVPARAAELTLTLSYLGSNTADFSNPYVLDICRDADQFPIDPTDIHDFAVWMELTDTAPGEDFEAVQFDVNLGAGAAPADFGGASQWTPNNPLVDPVGVPPPAPLFFENADIGTSDHDLVRIAALTNTASLPYVAEPGESGPFLLGDFWVTGDVWSVVIGPSTELSPNIALAPNGILPWGLWVDGVGVAQPASSFHHGGFVHPNCVPEPASCLLAGLAVLGLATVLLRERR